MMGEVRFYPEHDDEAEVREMVPVAKELHDLIRTRLPAGLHFGLLVLLPGEPMGRVVAVTSDRRKVAIGAAQWVLDVLKEGG